MMDYSIENIFLLLDDEEKKIVFNKKLCLIIYLLEDIYLWIDIIGLVFI